MDIQRRHDRIEVPPCHATDLVQPTADGDLVAGPAAAAGAAGEVGPQREEDVVCVVGERRRQAGEVDALAEGRR